MNTVAQLRAMAAVLLSVFVALLLAAAPAGAHAALSSSDPAAGARLVTAPQVVTLTFNEPVQHQFSTVVVTGPQGRNHVVGEPAVADREVRATLDTLDGNGTYTVAYRVVSADGHPVSGKYDFQLSAPTSTATSATSAAPETTAPRTSDNTSSGVTAWPFIAGAAVLVVLIAGTVWVRGRRGPGADTNPGG
ncbi:copper resistance CopC family protein [Mycobacterium sp. ACS4331]|uniref:copper resistance CopC family protein n=1 Tax=Mycobacterium sp. ACS4331 TaxID=1834121 RepID=UPI0007FC3C99|nr:copper resistance CopC family protein [Mycobacterium sp. ACS4331]OBF28501.1 hypothetical protein A5727_25355 [Mycobacterium sp. ACS4331]